MAFASAPRQPSSLSLFAAGGVDFACWRLDFRANLVINRVIARTACSRGGDRLCEEESRHGR
jgi:hypothetical protein